MIPCSACSVSVGSSLWSFPLSITSMSGREPSPSHCLPRPFGTPDIRFGSLGFVSHVSCYLSVVLPVPPFPYPVEFLGPRLSIPLPCRSTFCHLLGGCLWTPCMRLFPHVMCAVVSFLYALPPSVGILGAIIWFLVVLSILSRFRLWSLFPLHVVS